MLTSEINEKTIASVKCLQFIDFVHLNAQCGTNNSSCHINPSADGGCGLANYTDMLDYLVTPAKDIKFMKTVNHDPSISATLYMPKLPLPKIDDCSIQKLQAWINDGKLNN